MQKPGTLPIHSLLSTEEVERIRAEELVRYQAREEAKTLFTPKTSLLVKAHAFVNSAFGLWMLSTILIGYGTYEFRNMQERNTRRRDADRLEIELRHRLSHFNKVIGTLHSLVKDTEENGNDPWGHKFASRLRDEYRYIQTAESAFFSNYANDNIQSLFSGLQDKLRGLDEKKVRIIDDCLNEMKVVRRRCEDDYNDVPRPDNPNTHSLYFRKLREMIDDVLARLNAQPLNHWASGDLSVATMPPP